MFWRASDFADGATPSAHAGETGRNGGKGKVLDTMTSTQGSGVDLPNPDKQSLLEVSVLSRASSDYFPGHTSDYSGKHDTAR